MYRTITRFWSLSGHLCDRETAGECPFRSYRRNLSDFRGVDMAICHPPDGG